jgi:hypothetical protein
MPDALVPLYRTAHSQCDEGSDPLSPPACIHWSVEEPVLKACQFCADEIKNAAIVCKHCWRGLPPGPSSVIVQVEDMKRRDS